MGGEAVHPLTGEELRVCAANFVLMGYGSGAGMAVPAHDQRDWEFERTYSLPIQMVIGLKPGVPSMVDEAAYTEKGVLLVSPPSISPRVTYLPTDS